MLSPDQFKELVIVPVLLNLGMWSRDAEDLLIDTALAETGLRWLKQIKGPALGLYQMEPGTHDDIWKNFLIHRESMARRVGLYLNLVEDRHAQLATNLSYATAMARVHYWRVPEPLPSTLAGRARYWKRYYNGPGKGTIEHFTAAHKAAYTT